jgi:hypothetical protein
MTMPGFVAEAAIYRSSGRYRAAASPVVLRAGNSGGGILPAIPKDPEGEVQYGYGPCINGWQQVTWPNESYRQACTSCGDCVSDLTGQLMQTCQKGNTTYTQSCQVCFDIPLPWPVPDLTLCVNSLNPIDITVP